LLAPHRAGIEVGQRAVFLQGMIPTELRCEPGAQLTIGSYTMLNYGVSIVARRSVRIGARCMLASMVHVRDDDGRTSGPVTIGDDVWIAHGAIVEPGTTIGDGSVIATMAVVCGDIPPRSLVAGNPARCIPLEPASAQRLSRPTPLPLGRQPQLGARAGAVGPEAHRAEEVRGAILEWLDDTRHFGAAAELVRDSASLRDDGLLDSLGFVQLLSMLETRFGVEIDRERVAHPGAQSVDALIELVAGSGESADAKQPLHRVAPDRRARCLLSDFARFVAGKTGRRHDDYASLHAFSIADVELFWALMLEWSGVATSGDSHPVCVGSGVGGTRFFPGLKLSWAESLLAERTASEEAAPAVIACDETGARIELSRAELRARVRAVAAALESRGLREGDRVVAVVRNTADTLVSCLAVTSLGASWSSIAPDMGIDAALSRFAPLTPKLLFAHRSTRQNGAPIHVPLADLEAGLPSLESTVVLDTGHADAAASPARIAEISLEQLERQGRLLPSADPRAPWRRFAFDHPLFVLFSSGTTGPSKCIVHGHGGTLLEHVKEHRLHCDLGPKDRLLFHTATGWMMWNWAVSALASGATVVLYDGSVSYPEPDALLRIVSREQVTVFGASPAYLQFLADSGVRNSPKLLASVREMYSTGSVLSGHLHKWAKEHLADVPLESISGGTDILGCFVMGSPWTDTYEGESSCLGLGLDVRIWSADGAVREGSGELVCARPFPSCPVGFVGDPDGARMRDAYFRQHEGVWTHGDLVELTPRGSARVLGRADGVLNIRGIRIGPTEIYDVLSNHVPDVARAMAVDEAAPEEPGGKRLVLFVVLRRGAVLDRALRLRIKKELRERASPAHVPSDVIEVRELPTTFSGKLSEAAMQDALNGRPVRNRSALRNPESIEAAVEAMQSQRAKA
jgi:acetoacetyl-CoA synthetase